MDKPNFYKKFFLYGGIYNLCISLPIWIFGVVDTATASVLFGMEEPPNLLFFHAMMWFVFAFGCGYIVVSRDIKQNHGVVIIGAMEKVAFFIDAVAVYAIGKVGAIVVVLGTVDLVFGIIFIEFLLWSKKQPKA